MQSYPLSYRIANRIYEKNFPLYRRLYFLYKKTSDRQWITRIKAAVRPGMTVLDIGGNIGFYTGLFSKLAEEEGSVHVFEPAEPNFRHLQSYAGSLANVTLNRKAAGEKTKKTWLYLSDELNVDHQTYDIGEDRSRVPIECVSIDDYFKGGETVDFVKMDIQGYDYFALLGMQDTLARSGRVNLMGELWPYGLNRAGADPLDYIKLLEALGFELEIPDEKTIAEKTGDKLFYHTFWATKAA